MTRKDSGKILLTVKENGISINWKILVIIMTVFFGGGGTYAGVCLVTKNTLDESIRTSEKKAEMRNIEQDAIIQKNAASIVDNNKIIGSIRISIDAIQNNQNKSIARQEARRITKTISNRKKRESAFDRLYDRNMKRLRKGEDPCFNMECN